MVNEIIGWVIGGIGIVLTIYFSLRKVKKLSYYSSNIVIIDPHINIEDLSIEYKGKNLDSLYKTSLIVVNRGTVPIKGDDISKNKPLVIELPEKFEIYDVSDITIIGENKFYSIEKLDNRHYKIGFDFLNANERMLFSVLHNCPIPGNPKLHGRIEGINEIEILSFPSKSLGYYFKRLSALIITILIAITFMFKYQYLGKVQYEVISIGIIIIAYAILVFWLWDKTSYKYLLEWIDSQPHKEE